MSFLARATVLSRTSTLLSTRSLAVFGSSSSSSASLGSSSSTYNNPSTFGGISNLTNSSSTRSFSTIPTDNNKDSHDDFKPKVKTPPAGDDKKAIYANIEKTIKSYPVVVFMKGTPAQPMCGFSAEVIRILNIYGVPIHGVNVLDDPVIRSTMKDYSNWPTFPQVYIKNDFIGGRDILAQMHSAGEIQPLISDIVQK